MFFYKIPTIALITFILLSSYHFGEHQWTLFEKPLNKLIKVFYFSYGLTIFSLIFYFNFLEVNEIIFDITSIRLEKIFYQYLLIGSSSLTFLLSILFYRQIQNQLLIQLILLTLYFFTVSVTDLVLSFAIYFVLWHSLPSIIEQTKFIYGFSEKNLPNLF